MAAVLGVAIWAGLQVAHTQPPEHPGEAPRDVSLVVDYGDGCEKHYPRLTWRADMTVLDLLQVARRHPHGIQLAVRGRGPTAFLERIDDLENQGAGGRNWIFSVNGKLGTRGMGVTRLQAGDRVLWKFRTADEPENEAESARR